MCFNLSNLVYSCRKKFTVAQKSVLSYLSFRTNDKTGQCNPSLRRMGLDVQLTRANLVLNLKWLDDNGWITISKSKNLTNQYTINVEKFAVDKAVDKPVCREMGGIGAIPLGGIGAIPEAVSEQYLNNHLNHNLLNHNNDWEEKICAQEEIAQNILIEMGWYKKQSEHYIEFFGAKKILSEIKKVAELCRAGRMPENKMGAYLRKVLINIDNRVKYRKIGGGHE